MFEIYVPDIDLITGRKMPYSEDEPARQLVEKLLLERGYTAQNVTVDAERTLAILGRELTVTADLLINLEGKAALVFRCAPGSTHSRHSEVISIARLISDPWPPFAVVSNGTQYDRVDTRTGKILATGPEAVPPPDELAPMAGGVEMSAPTRDDLEKAAKAYNAYCFLRNPGKCTA